MLKFIRLLFFLGLTGLGLYFLVIKTPEEQPVIKASEKQPAAIKTPEKQPAAIKTPEKQPAAEPEQKPQPVASESSETNIVLAENIDTNVRPSHSDQTSRKIIKNYLIASGGQTAHENLKNVTASGTIIEAGKSKSFELIETNNGQRRLTYSWKHLGRNYKMLYSFDGVHIWQQQLLPDKKHPEFYEGRPAWHFARQRWLIQPFVVPLKANFTFKYQGKSKFSARPAYLITGFGKNNARSWFYFDEETFLLTRWGGKSSIAGVEEYLDYRATEFTKINGVFLPKKIERLVGNDPFGKITFETITANQTIDPKIFYMPQNKIPTLRQAVKKANTTD